MITEREDNKQIKKIFISVFLPILLSANTGVVRAQEKQIDPLPTYLKAASSNDSISPFELVSRGYQGRYHDRGIGGFGIFKQRIVWREVTAILLVEAAIATGDVPAAARDDSQYLNAVDFHLQSAARR
jgi:hypothetical protein